MIILTSSINQYNCQEEKAEEKEMNKNDNYESVHRNFERL